MCLFCVKLHEALTVWGRYFSEFISEPFISILLFSGNSIYVQNVHAKFSAYYKFLFFYTFHTSGRFSGESFVFKVISITIIPGLWRSRALREAHALCLIFCVYRAREIKTAFDRIHLVLLCCMSYHATILFVADNNSYISLGYKKFKKVLALYYLCCATWSHKQETPIYSWNSSIFQRHKWRN